MPSFQAAKYLRRNSFYLCSREDQEVVVSLPVDERIGWQLPSELYLLTADRSVKSRFVAYSCF